MLTLFLAANIVNGSFESGFHGWTLAEETSDRSFATATRLRTGQHVDVGNNLMDYTDQTSVANFSRGLPMTGQATDGNWQALILQNGPATTRLSQVVELPKNPQLVFDLAYHNWDTAFSASQSLRIQVRDPDSDALLGTVFQTYSGSPAELSMSNQTIDISAFGNMTVRLQFEVVAQSTFFDVQLDNIHIADVAKPHGDVDPSDEDMPVDDQIAIDYAVADTGGCSTTGRNGAPLLALAALALVLRRRRR